MNLRDCLVRHGIVDSKRVCALPVATQLFFRNLLHTCDGAGRFLADADDLRTTLYRHALDRVSRLHITRWLAECHTADLVRLYTGPDGRGYGEVLKYGQRDSKRRVIHPAREADQLDFVGGAPPADPPREREQNRREMNSPQPPPEAGVEEVGSLNSVQADIGYRTQAQTDTELFNTLAGLEGSAIDKLTEAGRRTIKSALNSIRRVNGSLTPVDLERAAAAWRKLFPAASITARGLATHWAKLHGPAGAAAKPKAIIPDEPEFWRELLNEDYPDSKYSRGGEHEGTAWHDLPYHVRDLCLRDLPRWLQRTGRASRPAA